MSSNEAVFELFDVMGRLVLSEEITDRRTINIDRLDQGIYVYRVSGSGGKMVVE